MKKIFLYIIGFVSICFIIPFIFTKKFESEQVALVDENVIETEAIRSSS